MCRGCLFEEATCPVDYCAQREYLSGSLLVRLVVQMDSGAKRDGGEDGGGIETCETKDVTVLVTTAKRGSNFARSNPGLQTQRSSYNFILCAHTHATLALSGASRAEVGLPETLDPERAP